MALLGAMILSVTFVPAAIALFVTGKVKEEEGVVMRTARQRYAPVLAWVLRQRTLAFAGAALLVVLSGALASRMGSEFIPSLSEGDFALQALRVPGTSLSQSVQMQQRRNRSSSPRCRRWSGYSPALALPRSPLTRCRRTSPMPM